MRFPAFYPLFYCCCVLLLSACVMAQPVQDLSALKKKDQQTLATARDAIGRGQFVQARGPLDRLVEKHPGQRELYFLRSEVYRNLGLYAKAQRDIQTGIRAGGGDATAVVYRKLGEAAALGGDFSGAVAAYRQYVAKVPANAPGDRRKKAEALLSRAESAQALAARPVPYVATRFSDSINTAEHEEYFPTLNVKEDRMVFTRRVGTDEDFYVSRRNETGNWGTAEPLPGVNTEFNEGAQTLTADGNYLVYTACDRPGGYGGCDLHFYEWTGADWRADGRASASVNGRWNEKQPSISADGRLLFFTSNREGGYGGRDLYAVGRLVNGGWSAPQNLGPNINTAGNEDFPFWAADGRTLYFTSDGHPGLGKTDLFRVQLGVDSKWGQPKNLGYPINTAGNETNLFIALNGTTAYFSKSEIDTLTGDQNIDIYTFDLPGELQPAPATYLAATVTDAATGAPLRATVRLRPRSQTAPPFARTTDAEGTFLAVLPAGKDYAFTVDLEGYLFYADRFTLPEGLRPEEPYTLNIQLQAVTEDLVAEGTEADGSTAFRNVLFTSGSAKLLPVSSDELDRLGELLQSAKKYRVEISGHTDDIGEDADNLKLSRQRAAAVKTYLVGQGIAAERITTQGFGETKPVAENDTEAGRARNRRTTFRLY